MSMIQILQFIKREWSTIKSAPFTFIIAAALAFCAAYFVSSWRYEGVLGNLRAQLETQEQRTQFKDELISEYRERLHLAPSDVTAYSKMSNVELKQKTLVLVAKIRDFVDKDSRRSGELRNKIYTARMSTGATPTPPTEEDMNALLEDSRRTISEYSKQFSSESLMLRNELATRLPPNSITDFDYSIIDSPVNPIGMRKVSDLLETLANSLPIKETK